MAALRPKIEVTLEERCGVQRGQQMGELPLISYFRLLERRSLLSFNLPRVHSFDTESYPNCVEGDLNIFEYDLVLFPMKSPHVGELCHFFLVVANIRTQCIEMYDPLSYLGVEQCDVIRSFLIKAAKMIGAPYISSQWPITAPEGCPLQDVSSGLWICLVATRLTRRKSITRWQPNIDICRKYVARALLRQCLDGENFDLFEQSMACEQSSRFGGSRDPRYSDMALVEQISPNSSPLLFHNASEGGLNDFKASSGDEFDDLMPYTLSESVENLTDTEPALVPLESTPVLDAPGPSMATDVGRVNTQWEGKYKLVMYPGIYPVVI